jgi:hypothetical protein
MRAIICYTATLFYSPNGTLRQAVASNSRPGNCDSRPCTGFHDPRSVVVSLFLQTRHQAFLAMLDAPWLAISAPTQDDVNTARCRLAPFLHACSGMETRCYKSSLPLHFKQHAPHRVPPGCPIEWRNAAAESSGDMKCIHFDRTKRAVCETRPSGDRLSSLEY